MTRKNIVLPGELFGYLTVLEECERVLSKPSNKPLRQFLCKCKCGNLKKVRLCSLKNGNTKSCGCLKIETDKKCKHGFNKKGVVKKEYTAWQSMKDRCFNTNNQAYKNYGGRGLTVCDRWLESFENFLEDVGEAPSPKHSIDRINNDKNYEPGNVRWALRSTQLFNRRIEIRNTSGCTGVSFDKREQKWIAYINVNKKRINLGAFINKEDAIKSRKEAELKYYGFHP
jgi:hypothetical protein